MISAKLLVAGNWKMHGVRADLSQIEAVKTGVGRSTAVDVAIFLPAQLIESAARLADGSPLTIGAQDCHFKDSGAFTGDISAPMLRDAGARAVIVGHSERRTGHGETSKTVRAKAEAALRAGLRVIVCIGETKGERAAGLAESVCARQLTESVPDEGSPADIVIAYEPVWAIGSGMTPSPEDIGLMHKFLRESLHRRFKVSQEQRWRILYGGSVTPANASSIFSGSEVDGALVGGASLNASSFLAIIAAASEASKPKP